MAVEGDCGTVRIFQEFGKYLGASLVTYANTFSPDLIVADGGLAGAPDLYLG